jgi:hypothetical protein
MLAGKFLFTASFTAVQSEVMPIVAAALLLDSGIVAIWYFLGVLLSNEGVKRSARNEAYQLVGTMILAIIVIGFMLIFGSLFFNVLSTTALMSPTAISGMCQNVMGTTSLVLIGSPSNPNTKNTGSLLYGPETSTTQFEGICGIVKSASASPSLAEQIDYPLAAAATILANITNQTAANVNYAYTFDAFIGFLASVKPSIGICATATGYTSLCFADPEAAVQPVFDLDYVFQPYGGYDLLLTNLGTLGVLLTTALEMCNAELNFIVMSLYIWPYLLFIGLVLRATLFTRPLGGLFIAASLAIVLVFPATYAIEYLTLARPISSSTGTAYGFNPQTSLPANVLPSTGNYVLNFFVQPNLKGIIKNNDGCWPYDDSLIGAEVGDIAFLFIPFGSLLTGVVGSAMTGVPNVYLPNNCHYGSALTIFYQLLNAYGIIGMIIYVLPLLNIVIALTAMRGLSSLMGGDTELAGLAKFMP